MILYALSIFSIVTFVLCGAEELILPITTCKRNSTDYSTCLKEAVIEAWPRFVEGLPEFDFPRLDPLLYKDGKIILNRNGLNAEGNVINATIFGLALTRILDVRPHFLDDIFRLEIDMIIPKVFVHSYDSGQANLFGMRAGGADDILEDFLNEYWPPIYREFAPTVFETVDPFLTNIDNRFFSKVSFSKVFP
ncbi:uncharacterized protein LOC115238418 isoform X2 [Formica exsecta]|uniref:uncharacterized protein LOC115238418 isoform X2 n=1 Tax=Formica exsecta TaxID=72781 RepID=UPI00114472FE|nr:uncharacterized protein LOC115238418 isoform X2 [Formica exsecta]